MNKLPLKGVRVVDFSWVVAGPMATKMLAAMGAEVIKIESSQRPEFKNRSGYFPVVNAGKRSCTVNISAPEGQTLLRRLIAISDVMVENFSSAVLRKYCLSYEHVRQVRPDLVFCSASGVGRTGPQRDVLAYGTLLQGYSGRAGLVGEINPDLEAMGIVPAWTDPVTAMWETLAVLAALRHRRLTGEGAFIDLSMLESTVALLPEALLRASLGDGGPTSGANREEDASPSGCFPCAGTDSWLALSVRGDDEWRGLCAAMGRPDLAGDPRFGTHAQRLAEKATLNQTAAEWLAAQNAIDAERRLQAAGVPAARSRHTGDLMADPHLSQRGVFPESPDGTRTIALPWRDEDGWRGTIGSTPELGEANDYVFGELLGLPRQEIERLSTAGVIQ